MPIAHHTLRISILINLSFLVEKFHVTLTLNQEAITHLGLYFVPNAGWGGVEVALMGLGFGSGELTLEKGKGEKKVIGLAESITF